MWTQALKCEDAASTAQSKYKVAGKTLACVLITDLSYQKNNENSKGLQKDSSAGAGNSSKALGIREFKRDGIETVHS